VRQRRLAFSLALVTVSSALTYASTRPLAATSIDQIFAAYAGGDHTVVARSVRLPSDFAPLRLDKPSVIDDWLGAWNQRKAMFVIELAFVASEIAPAKTWPLLAAGRRYVAERPSPPGTPADEDAFERMWHQMALGLLQRHSLADYEETYFATLRKRTATATSSVLPARFALAQGIAQEQRCWNDRPDLDRAGAAVDAVARAAGQDVKSRVGVSKSMVEVARERQEACWTECLNRFTAAAASTDAAGAEASVRGAWISFQLGKVPDALRMIDGVEVVDDPTLAYWAGLFRGRIDNALGRHADAERAYRAALAARPDAQSAGVGLALTLFRLNRDAEADAVAVAVRTRATVTDDPWWTYMSGDYRFVDHWIESLRGTPR
jgi:hypothetical protein